MNKKTQILIGVAAVAGLAIWLANRNKKKDSIFANFAKSSSRAAVGCKFYAGSCGHSVGTRITNWVDGGGQQGIIVSSSSSQCLVCPVSNTASGLPSS